jgi:exosortase
VALGGVFVMVGGMRSLRWAGWPIVFLIFMLPLPQQLDGTLSADLQTQATASSTYVLQTIGVGAVRSGSVISVGHNGVPMNVEEACSGLRMLTIFGALCFAVALLIDLPMWQRVIIVLSSVPIALAVNILRIVATGVLFTLLPGSEEKLKHFFHDGAGLVMMPLAMVLLFLEYKILTNLFIEDEEGLVPPLGLAATTNGSGRANAGAVAMSAATPKRIAQPAAAPMAPISAKPLPARPMPTASVQKPNPAKPLPLRPVAAKPVSSPPATSAAARPLPTRPLPAKQLPVNSGSPIPAQPLPAKPLPNYLASAKPPAVSPAAAAGDSVASKPPQPVPSGEATSARR